MAGGEEVVAARLQTEGVTAVDWEVERGQDHQQASTACLGPDCPGAGGEEREGGWVVRRGEDSHVVRADLATPQVQAVPD